MIRFCLITLYGLIPIHSCFAQLVADDAQQIDNSVTAIEAAQLEKLQHPQNPQLQEQTQQTITHEINNIETVADRQPESPKVQLKAAQAFQTVNEPQRSFNHADQAVRLDPQNPAAYLVRGDASYKLGRYEEARRDAAQVLKLEPRNAAAVSLLRLTEGRADSSAATGAAGTVPAASASPEARRGRSGRGQGVQPLPRSLADDTARGSALAAQADATARGLKSDADLKESSRMLQLGDPRAALKLADQAVAADPRNPNAWAQRAGIRFRAQDWDGVVADATRALGLGAKQALLYDLRSLGHYQKREFRLAEEDADRAIAIEPNNGQAWRNRALARAKLGEPREAVLADFRRAAELDPSLARQIEDQMRGFGLAEAGGGPGQGGSLGGGASGANNASGTGRGENNLRPDDLRAGFWRGLRRRAENNPVLSGAILSFLILWATLAAAYVKWVMPGSSPEGDRPRRASGDEEAAGTRAGGAPGTGREENYLRPENDLRPGDVLGGFFEIRREIGRGGMGIVFEAWDRTLRRRVAVKTPHPDLRASPKELERFFLEARAVAGLQHPNVVAIFDVVPSAAFLLFEFIHGRTLEQHLAAALGGRLPLPEVRRIAEAAAAALDHAHGRGIVHRDLKPSNIMLEWDDAAPGAANAPRAAREENDFRAVKVMDFGIARVAKDSRAKTTGTIAGTPLYMAPEQAEGKASPRSDLYALGICLYEMLTGAAPFSGPAQLELKRAGECKPPSALEPGLPPAIDDFFKKALEPDPAKRFQTGAELAAALRRIS